MNLLLQVNHIAARSKFGTSTQRLAHLSYLLTGGPHAGVSSFTDFSIYVKYPERQFLFAEFFTSLIHSDFFNDNDIAKLRQRGNEASRDDIREALVRYALTQENLTDGGAYLISRDAYRQLHTPGALQGFATHNFILAHELSHRLLDEIHTAPQLARWVDDNSLNLAHPEIAADALAVALIQAVHGLDDWVDAEGAITALATLQAVETGWHARVPTVEPTLDERQRALFDQYPRLAGFYRNFHTFNASRCEFLLRACSYTHPLPRCAWDALRFLLKRRRITVKGPAAAAINLAQFGDIPLALGHTDTDLDALRESKILADRFTNMLVHDGEGISSYTSRYAETLGIHGEGREILEDPSCLIRYYDLIAWILNSSEISTIAKSDWETGYSLAIYLAGTYRRHLSENTDGRNK